MTQQEEPRPDAAQVIVDLLRPVSPAQVIAYLERTGWKLWANHFTWSEGWSMRPEIVTPTSWIYRKPDPEAVVEVPGREEFRNYLSNLQFAVERIATVEQTTFVTVICHILDVKQVVLRPIEDQPEQKGCER